MPFSGRALIYLPSDSTMVSAPHSQPQGSQRWHRLAGRRLLKILLSAERGQSAARGRGQLRKAGRAQSSPPNSVVHRPWVRDREKDTLELRQNQQQCLPHRGKVLLLNLQSKQSFPSCSLQPAKSQGRKHRDRRKHNGNANHVSISLDGMCKWTGRAPVTSN